MKGEARAFELGRAARTHELAGTASAEKWDMDV